ncbi:unnamed protein product [Phytophthora fragariaefolia]|uniref:Unnamed protein product n=1 Tax=Phytophthora fragariaefolia TaxID=1490495 RepID=A0A9W7D5F0_9STRA|nr:unnamed protein product [Phytophthora fragariaefolia]
MVQTTRINSLFGLFSAYLAYWEVPVLAMLPNTHASTNNPVEQFNRILKRDYTLWARLKMGSLIHQQVACYRHQSMSPKEFKSSPEPNSTLRSRVTSFRSHNLLCEHIPDPRSIDVLLSAPNPSTVHVISTGAERIKLPNLRLGAEIVAVSAQMGVNYARMELENRPSTGWAVDIGKECVHATISLNFGHAFIYCMLCRSEITLTHAATLLW